MEGAIERLHKCAPISHTINNLQTQSPKCGNDLQVAALPAQIKSATNKKAQRLLVLSDLSFARQSESQSQANRTIESAKSIAFIGFVQGAVIVTLMVSFLLRCACASPLSQPPATSRVPVAWPCLLPAPLWLSGVLHSLFPAAPPEPAAPACHHQLHEMRLSAVLPAPPAALHQALRAMHWSLHAEQWPLHGEHWLLLLMPADPSVTDPMSKITDKQKHKQRESTRFIHETSC